MDLPNKYQKTYELNMKDKKFGIIINLISIAVLAIMIFVFLKIKNISVNFGYTLESLWISSFFLLRTFACLAAIMLFHEALKSVILKGVSKGKISIKANLMFLNATVANRFFSKKTYIFVRIIAFLVVNVMGVVLVLLLKETIWYIPMFIGLGQGIATIVEVLAIIISLVKAKKVEIIRDTALTIEGYTYLEPNTQEN